MKRNGLLCILLMLLISFSISHFPFSIEPMWAEGTERKKFVAYIGGNNELVKIDMETYKITKTSGILGVGVIGGISISQNKKEIYITGTMFSAPMIIMDSKKLEILKKVNEELLEDAKFGTGFDCEGVMSPDGKRFVIYCLGGGLVIMDMQKFIVINKISEYHVSPTYQVIFSDDSKFFYVLTEVANHKKISIYNSETGKALKQVKLLEKEDIECGVNISKYINEKSDIYIICFRKYEGYSKRGLIKGDAVYPSITIGKSKKIELIKASSGKIISELKLPEGRGELNQVVLTPDNKKLLIGRGGYRDPGELTIVDVASQKVLARIMLDGGVTSNIVFGYE